MKYDELEKCFNECQEKLEEIENYLEAEMKKANIECKEAKTNEMTPENREKIAYWNGRVKAFIDALNWITGKDEKDKIYKISFEETGKKHLK